MRQDAHAIHHNSFRRAYSDHRPFYHGAITGEGSMAENEPRAIRLTFAYKGNKIELTDADRIAMSVPPTDPFEGSQPTTGFWLELRGGNERTLFRRMMHDPIGYDREIFPDRPGGEIIRRPIASPEGVFSVVIPEIKDMETLTFHSSPAGGPERGRYLSQEVARFDLRPILLSEGGYRQ
jgi:hypothetical protein